MASWQFHSRPGDVDSHPILRTRKRMVNVVLSLLEKEGKPILMSEISERTNYARNSLSTTLYMLKKSGAVKLVDKERGNKGVDAIYQYASVKKWLGELKPGDSVRAAKYIFFDFLQFVRENTTFRDPEELLKSALNSNIGQLQEHVSLTRQFILQTQKGVVHSTRLKRYFTVRSYYLHNGVTLPGARLGLAETSSDTEVTMNDLFSTSMLVMLRKVLMSGKVSVRNKAAILVVCQGGMDDSTLTRSFNYVAYAQLSAHFGTADFRRWDSKQVPVRLNLIRPKTGKAFYTFIDRDAVEALKDYLAVRFRQTGKEIQVYQSKRSDRVPLSDPIFIAGNGKPLRAQYFSQLFRVAGFLAGVNVKPDVKVGSFQGSTIRYPFHSHEVRDALKTLGHHLGLKDEVEFFLGHEIDRLKYDKHPDHYPDYWRELYMKLSPFLNVVSNDPEKADLVKRLEQTHEEKTKIESQLFVHSKILEEQLAEERAKGRRRDELVEYLFKLEDLKDRLGVENDPGKRERILGEIRELRNRGTYQED